MAFAQWGRQRPYWRKRKDWLPTRQRLAFGCAGLRASATRRARAKGEIVDKSAAVVPPSPRARVRAMKEYHPPLGNRDAMRLDFNENTVACSPRVREILGRISGGALTRYPERAPVERILAKHLGVAPEQLVLTNGVDEAIHVLFETFLDAGD